MKTVSKKKIKDLFILCFIFFPFVSFSNIIQSEVLLNSFRILSTFLITIFTIKSYKQNKMDMTIISLILISIYMVIISLINSTLSSGILFNIYFIFISSLYIISCFENKEYTVFYAINLLFSLTVIINIPSVINSLSVSEYNKMFLVGGKNSLCILCLSSIYYVYLHYYLKNKKISLSGLIIIIIDLLTMLLSGSSTAFIVGIITTLFIFIFKNIKISYKIYILVYILMFFLILNTKYIENIPIISDFITKGLNKNLSFTGRSYIWENVIKYIKMNPLGYGRGNLVVNTFSVHTECHNAFLELTLSGGFPSLLLFIVYLISIFKMKVINYNSQIVNVSKFLIFSFMILGLTESIIFNNNLWWILIILYSINKYHIKNECND